MNAEVRQRSFSSLVAIFPLIPSCFLPPCPRSDIHRGSPIQVALDASFGQAAPAPKAKTACAGQGRVFQPFDTKRAKQCDGFPGVGAHAVPTPAQHFPNRECMRRSCGVEETGVEVPSQIQRNRQRIQAQFFFQKPFRGQGGIIPRHGPQSQLKTNHSHHNQEH